MRRNLSAILASAIALVMTTAAFAQDEGNAARGKEFALQTCAICHIVSRAQVAPKRLATAPPFAAIANMASTTSASLRVFLSSPHPSMPNLILTPREQQNVIAYIMSLKR